MPVRRLSVFSGNKRDYQVFVHTFDSCVASKATTEGEKLEFLLQYVEGEARELIEDMYDLPESKHTA